MATGEWQCHKSVAIDGRWGVAGPLCEGVYGRQLVARGAGVAIEWPPRVIPRAAVGRRGLDG
jgi:hypothetical protein